MRGTVITACLVGGYAVSGAAQADQLQPLPAAPAAPAVSAAELLEQHDCWTGQGPEGVIPGHVVVTVDGQPTLGGSRMTGKALAQIFDGADHGLDAIHGFCR